MNLDGPFYGYLPDHSVRTFADDILDIILVTHIEGDFPRTSRRRLVGHVDVLDVWSQRSCRNLTQQEGVFAWSKRGEDSVEADLAAVEW